MSLLLEDRETLKQAAADIEMRKIQTNRIETSNMPFSQSALDLHRSSIKSSMPSINVDVEEPETLHPNRGSLDTDCSSI